MTTPGRNERVRIVSPFGPGGFTDLIVENMLPRFSEQLGAEITVDYEPGWPVVAALAPRNVSKAEPDGNTLLIGTVGNIALLPAIYPNYGINPLTDLTSITLLAQAADILVTRPGLGVDDLASLIARSKQEPGTLTYNAIAPASIHYLEMLTLGKEAGIELAPPQFSEDPNEAPYQAVRTGEVDLLISTPARTFPHLASGEMKGLALIAEERSAGAPELPTLPELGIASLHTGSWAGLFGPPGMEQDLVREIASAAREALYTTDGLREKLDQVGIAFDVSDSPEAFQTYLESEAVRLAGDVAATGFPVLKAN